MSADRSSTSSSRVRVREARADDGPALVRLDAATWSDSVSPAPAPDPRTEFFGDSVSPGDVLVAEIDDTVVGYVTVVPRFRGLPAGEHVYEIRGLAVCPESQRMGIGRRLVQGAAELARAREARRLSLHVLGSNPVARRLYERCGFVVEGVYQGEFYLRGRYVDDLVLALDLQTHTTTR